MRCVSLRIEGLVQGVFFRAQTKRTADELGIVGFVRNEPDGSVYVEACGEDVAIEAFISWCKKGPERAQVEKVSVIEKEPKSYVGFEVNG